MVGQAPDCRMPSAPTGFVGLVGVSVISATTLFVGFKSVEVVRNESITTAEASAPEPSPTSAVVSMPTHAGSGSGDWWEQGWLAAAVKKKAGDRTCSFLTLSTEA